MMVLGMPRRSAPAQWVALVTGIAALVWCLGLGRPSPRAALLSYLFAFLFFSGVTVGSLALAMVHALTGGAWGLALRPYLMAAAGALPLQAVLSLPILLGVTVLYPWSTPSALAHDAVLRAQSWYLNPTFFVVRTVLCFGAWLLLLIWFRRGLEQPQRLPRVAATGLIIFGLTATIAAVDWVMSLVPHWHSSIFGMTVATGWLLSAAAFSTLCATWIDDTRPPAPPGLLKDFGTLLLTLVLVWSYLAFMQYLTIWIGDLPTETTWYIPRTQTSWRFLAWFLIAFHFAIPFAVLLSRRAKQLRRWLAGVAALLLIAHLADALWLVIPDFHPGGVTLAWTELLAPIGIGGVWLHGYLGRVRVAYG